MTFGFVERQGGLTEGWASADHWVNPNYESSHTILCWAGKQPGSEAQEHMEELPPGMVGMWLSVLGSSQHRGGVRKASLALAVLLPITAQAKPGLVPDKQGF